MIIKSWKCSIIQQADKKVLIYKLKKKNTCRLLVTVSINTEAVQRWYKNFKLSSKRHQIICKTNRLIYLHMQAMDIVNDHKLFIISDRQL